MKETALMLCYLLIAILIGVLTKIFQLDGLESLIVLQFQKMIAYGIPVQVFLIITYLGDIRFLIVLSLIFFTYSYYRRRRLDKAFELLAFLAIATVSTYILKELFGRERPFIYSKNITSYADENDFSYPSGHVSRSLGAYSIIFKGYKRGDIICSLLTVFISLSRIVLGAHYFTDLVGAIFLSLFSGKLARILLQSINKRFMLLGKM
jgi:undecaprenyl-diphosphatase